MQPDRQRLGEREFTQADVAGDRIALTLAQDEILGEHALHMRVEARAAQETHMATEVLPTFATVVAAPAGLRRTHRDLVTGLHPRDAFSDSRHDP